MTEEIVIVAAKRTPIGNLNGFFADIPSPQLAATALRGALESINLPSGIIENVFLGCVLSAGIGQAPARQAALGANLSNKTPCTTINKMCGSGMQTVIMAHDTLKSGSYKVIVAGGMENMSRAPYLVMGARQGLRLGHQKLYDHMLLDGLEDAYEKEHHMGYFAELCAQEYQITRQVQDQFALESVMRARKAIENEWFKDEIIPITIVKNKHTEIITHDQGPFSINPEKIPHLHPVFKKQGTITAANASSIADGAAILILTTHSQAKHLASNPLAKIIGHYSYAQEPARYTTAPIAAIKGLLHKINWKVADVDLFEINEAFAVVTLVAMQQLKLDHQRVNVNGGSCILGHPIGASGARILVTLIHALQQRGLKRGIAALCIGGGEATAVAVEILS